MTSNGWKLPADSITQSIFMTETKFLIYGRNIRTQMNDCLSYLYPTAEEAVAACRKNHPDFAIYDVSIDDSPVPSAPKVQSLV